MSDQGWFFIPRPTWRDRLRQRWLRLIRRDRLHGFAEIGFTTDPVEDDETGRATRYDTGWEGR